MRRLVLAAVAALVVTGAGVAAGTLLTSTDDVEPSPEPPSFSTTPLASFDTSTLTVPRSSFCAAVDPRQVSAALGGDATDQSSYENGEEVRLTDGLTDVAHEFGCTWTGADGSEVRAWVFAPPVDRARAQGLVADASRAQGCESSPTPAFGTPSVGVTCTSEGGTTRVSYRGLFGDAWLTCELTSADASVDPETLRDQAGAWCVGVAMGASS